MSDFLLFSAIGSTDPIRNNYDGPMLHIIRHYRPHKVILFFTKEMGKREKENHIYSKAIKSIDEKIKIEYIYSEIINAHDFNEYSTIIPEYLNKLFDKNESEEILVNISSGTLQLINSINLHIVSSSFNYIPVQTVTPDEKANTSRVVSNPYDVDIEIENNFDNDVSFNTKNRTKEIDLNIYRRTLITEQLKGLIKIYNYDACHTLIKDDKSAFPDRIKNLSSHCKYRMLFDFDKSNNYLNNEYKYLKIDDNYTSKIIEYFNVLNIKYKNSNYNDFLIMLIPLSEELMKKYLKQEYHIDINSIKDKANKNYTEIIESKFKAKYPKLYNKFSNDYSRAFKSGVANNEFYFLFDLISHLDDLKNDNWYKVFNYIKDIKDDRNIAAHQLNMINEENKQKFGKITSELEKFIIKYYKNNLKKNQLNVYDYINGLILKELM